MTDWTKIRRTITTPFEQVDEATIEFVGRSGARLRLTRLTGRMLSIVIEAADGTTTDFVAYGDQLRMLRDFADGDWG